MRRKPPTAARLSSQAASVAGARHPTVRRNASDSGSPRQAKALRAHMGLPGALWPSVMC